MHIRAMKSLVVSKVVLLLLHVLITSSGDEHRFANMAGQCLNNVARLIIVVYPSHYCNI